MTKEELCKKLEKGPLILDGATGTMMMKAGMPKNACTEKWISEHPDEIISLQRQYADAGSDIIYAPTFGANRISLAKHGLSGEVGRLNKTLVALTKEAVGGRALVAGDMTTTGQLMDPLGDLEYDELFEAYKEQAESLIDAGVDLIIAETMMAVDETLCLLDAVRSISDIAVMCTLTVQADGSLFFGSNVFEGSADFEAAGAAAVGCNCSVGPDQLVSVISGIKRRVHVPVIAKPNAGMPSLDADGNAVYDMKPDVFAKHMAALKEAGASLLGGCCGTNPEFIREIKKAVL